MNRERILFASVVAIIALWFFVMREEPQLAGKVEPGVQKHDVLPVRAVERNEIVFTLPQPYGAFTRVTNEKEHPRPMLPPVAGRDLPNIAVPTSRGPRTSLLGRLRHNTVAPETGEATLTLPAIGENGEGVAGAGTAVDFARADKWTALGNAQEGKVVRVRFKGSWIKDPGSVPAPGKPADADFHRLLALCELDEASAADAGVSEIEVELKVGGQVRYPFPAEINGLQVATAGTSVPYFEGLKSYLRLPARGYQQRLDRGQRLLAAGKAAGGLDPRIGWSLIFFDEARAQAGDAVQGVQKEILTLQLDAATALFRHELVLKRAFEYLSRFPGDADVIENVGTLLASRTFGLLEQAEEWFAKAPQSSSAQLKRVGVLIRLDRFEDARAILASGRAGSGPVVSLVTARAALALGDFAAAKSKASPFAVGANALEANLILGGVAYAEGDLAKAQEYFLAALDKDPRSSEAYSDLGLTMARQGKVADAEACFVRAGQLDFENTVAPGLGRVYLKFAAADAAMKREAQFRAEAETRKNKAELVTQADAAAAEAKAAIDEALAMLTGGDDSLEVNNPLNLLIRYFVGYARERAGDLEGAHEKYRAVIDNDHRYRLAIARLGVVLARFVEANPGHAKADEYAKAADAHLTKAQDLNPNDAVLPYLLARFHMVRGTQAAKAKRMFSVAKGLPAPRATATCRTGRAPAPRRWSTATSRSTSAASSRCSTTSCATCAA